MWIFFPHAMLSIVAHRDKPDTLLVRARFKGDIERVFPRALVKRTPSADYLYRAEVLRREVSEALRDAVGDLHYTNVKGAIPMGDTRRHGAMHDVWQVMFNAQHGAEPFARLDGAEEGPAQPIELHSQAHYAHTTCRGEPRTVFIHQVHTRTRGEPDVTLEYLETGKVMTVGYSTAQHWLRDAALLP